MKNTITQTLKILIAAILLSMSVGHVFAAWRNPTASPPGNNADAPINVGGTPQTKKGDFSLSFGKIFTATTGNFGGINVGPTSGARTGSIKATGTICDKTACIGEGGSSAWATSDGNINRVNGKVGIGMTTPWAKLDVFSRGERIMIGADSSNASIELIDTDGDGRSPYIDFSNSAGDDFDMRLILEDDNTLVVDGGKLKVNGHIESPGGVFAAGATVQGGTLRALSKFCFGATGNNCITSWPSGGGSSLWKDNNGFFVYHTGSPVLINTTRADGAWLKVVARSRSVYGILASGYGEGVLVGVQGEGVNQGVRGKGGGIGVHGIASRGTGVRGEGPLAGVEGSSRDTGVRGHGTKIGIQGSSGAIDFYAAGARANYLPFTGAHEVRLVENFTKNNKLGMIVSVTGEAEVRKDDQSGISLSSTLPTVVLSSNVNDKNVFGVLVSEFTLPKDHWYTPKDNERFGIVNALGEGRVWVTNISGDISSGDYITTSLVPGYGQMQDDDILHSYTFGKSIENVDWSSVTDTVSHNGKTYKKYLIGVVYTSG